MACFSEIDPFAARSWMSEEAFNHFINLSIEKHEEGSGDVVLETHLAQEKVFFWFYHKFDWMN